MQSPGSKESSERKKVEGDESAFSGVDDLNEHKYDDISGATPASRVHYDSDQDLGNDNGQPPVLQGHPTFHEDSEEASGEERRLLKAKEHLNSLFAHEEDVDFYSDNLRDFLIHINGSEEEKKQAWQEFRALVMPESELLNQDSVRKIYEYVQNKTDAFTQLKLTNAKNAIEAVDFNNEVLDLFKPLCEAASEPNKRKALKDYSNKPNSIFGKKMISLDNLLVADAELDKIFKKLMAKLGPAIEVQAQSAISKFNPDSDQNFIREFLIAKKGSKSDQQKFVKKLGFHGYRTLNLDEIHLDNIYNAISAQFDMFQVKKKIPELTVADLKPGFETVKKAANRNEKQNALIFNLPNVAIHWPGLSDQQVDQLHDDLKNKIISLEFEKAKQALDQLAFDDVSENSSSDKYLVSQRGTDQQRITALKMFVSNFPALAVTPIDTFSSQQIQKLDEYLSGKIDALKRVDSLVDLKGPESMAYLALPPNTPKKIALEQFTAFNNVGTFALDPVGIEQLHAFVDKKIDTLKVIANINQYDGDPNNIAAVVGNHNKIDAIKMHPHNSPIPPLAAAAAAAPINPPVQLDFTVGGTINLNALSNKRILEIHEAATSQYHFLNVKKVINDFNGDAKALDAVIKADPKIVPSAILPELEKFDGTNGKPKFDVSNMASLKHLSADQLTRIQDVTKQKHYFLSLKDRINTYSNPDIILQNITTADPAAPAALQAAVNALIVGSAVSLDPKQLTELQDLAKTQLALLQAEKTYEDQIKLLSNGPLKDELTNNRSAVIDAIKNTLSKNPPGNPKQLFENVKNAVHEKLPEDGRRKSAQDILIEDAMQAIGLPITDAVHDVLEENRKQHIENIANINYRENKHQSFIVEVSKQFDNERYALSFIEAKLKREAEHATSFSLEEVKKYNHTVFTLQEHLTAYKKYLEDMYAQLELWRESISAVDALTKHQKQRDFENGFPTPIGGVASVYEYRVKRGLEIVGDDAKTLQNINKEMDILRRRLQKIDIQLDKAERIINSIQSIRKKDPQTGGAYKARFLALGDDIDPKRVHQCNDIDVARDYAARVLQSKSSATARGGIASGHSGTTESQYSVRAYQVDTVLHVQAGVMRNVHRQVKPVTLTSVTVEEHSKAENWARSEFHFNQSDLEKIARQPREPVLCKATDKNTGAPVTVKIEIPPREVLEWAEQNLKTFSAVMPKNSKGRQLETLKITPGELPEVCIKALLLMCKHLNIRCAVPRNSKAVDDLELQAFTQKWAEWHPKDKSHASYQQTEAKILSRRLGG